MASTVPGLTPPLGATPDFTTPYTLQPYQTLTAAASGILTTIMVVARLYTVSTALSYSFSTLFQDETRNMNRELSSFSYRFRLLEFAENPHRQGCEMGGLLVNPC